MKKSIITLGLGFMLNAAYSQSYTVLLDKLNVFLKTFDNQWYGHLEIKDNTLYDYYKAGTYSKMNIYDISEAKVVEAGKKVEIYCNSGSCVTTNAYVAYESMPFSTDINFDAQGFADKLNALVAAYKKQYPPGNNYSTNNTVASNTTAAFPVGARVQITKVDKPYNTYEVLFGDNDVNVIGVVSGSDLVPLGDNWYSGRIKLDDGKVKVCQKAQFLLLK